MACLGLIEDFFYTYVLILFYSHYYYHCHYHYHYYYFYYCISENYNLYPAKCLKFENKCHVDQWKEPMQPFSFHHLLQN